MRSAPIMKWTVWDARLSVYEMRISASSENELIWGNLEDTSNHRK